MGGSGGAAVVSGLDDADTIQLAKQAQEAGVKHLALTHLIPYPEGAVSRYLFTRGMSEHFNGEITVARTTCSSRCER